MRDYYYLFAIQTALGLLEHASAETSILRALKLHECEETPIRDAFSDAKEAPDRSIIVDDGRVVGFVTERLKNLLVSRDSVVCFSRVSGPPSLIAVFPDSVPVAGGVLHRCVETSKLAVNWNLRSTLDTQHASL